MSGRGPSLPQIIGNQQALQQCCVSSRELMREEVGTRHPLQRRTTERLRFASNYPADKKLQMHGFFGIGVRRLIKQSAHAHLDAQLLLQFTNEASFEGFAGFALATGKFPQTTEMRIGMASGDKKLARSEDEAG